MKNHTSVHNLSRRVALVALLALLSAPTTTAAQSTTWLTQTSGVGGDILAVSFTDANTGTAVGVGGMILRTTDGGARWVVQDSFTDRALRGVSFTDTNTGTVVGGGHYGADYRAGSVILRTTDGGAHWTSQTSPATDPLNAVSFANDTTGVAVGLMGTILWTTNAGSTWTRQPVLTDADFYGVSMTSPSTATLVGTYGTILRTSDGGTTWTQQGPYEIKDMMGVSFSKDGNIGMAVGRPSPEWPSSVILRTTDGGATWLADDESAGDPLWNLYGVSLANASTATVVGGDYSGNSSGLILRTTDGGATWARQSTDTHQWLLGVSFTDANTGTAVGTGGVILRTPTGSGLGISAVQASGITANSAAITWTTTAAATSQVNYGTTTAYGMMTPLDQTLVTNHAQTLSGLAGGTTYHYEVISQDAAGNTVRSDDRTFATAASPLTVTINQASGQADPTNATPLHFTAVFSEPVSDFTSGDVTVGGTAGGTKTVTLTGGGTTYDVAVGGITTGGSVTTSLASGSAHDLAGNGNAASTSTDNVVTYDSTPPTVTSTSPGNGATGVPASASVSAAFSEAITSSTINTWTFTLTGGGVPVGGTVGYTAATDTATFTPGQSLELSRTYTATVTTGVKDLAGNPLAQSVSWSFTTPAVMHVGSLVGTSVSRQNEWQAQVTTKVIDASGSPLVGVTVTGSFSNGGNGSCTTDTTGVCTLTSGSILKKVDSVVFTITGLARPGYAYDASLNTITSLTISRK